MIVAPKLVGSTRRTTNWQMKATSNLKGEFNSRFRVPGPRPGAGETISKPWLGCYYCLLLQFQYIIRIMTLLFAIVALLLQYLFCKCPDYYSSLLHYLQKDYYGTYHDGNNLISLIVFGIYYCYYCYYHTIIYTIVNSHYYDYYIFWEVLFQLSFSKPIIGIMTIIYYY